MHIKMIYASLQNKYGYAFSHVEVWIESGKRKNGKQDESTTQDIIVIVTNLIEIIYDHNRMI